VRHGPAGLAAITAVTVAFAVGFAVLSAWLALLLELDCWTAALVIIPGTLAARRWQAAC
jgi:hypothetical protein